MIRNFHSNRKMIIFAAGICLIAVSCKSVMSITPKEPIIPVITDTITEINTLIKYTSTFYQPSPSETHTLLSSPTQTIKRPDKIMQVVPITESKFSIIDQNGKILRYIDIYPLRHWNDIGMMAWAPDGEKVVFSACDEKAYSKTKHMLSCEANYYIYNLVENKVKLFMEKQNEDRINLHVDWSQDNNWIAFGINRGNRSIIYIARPDGNNNHSIFSIESQNSWVSAEVASWTMDNQYLLFYVLKGGSAPNTCYSDIWIVDIEGKNPKLLVKDFLSCGALHVAVSPDGTTIFYRSDPGTFMSPIECYYKNNCNDIPSRRINYFPVTWYKDYVPRWTVKYPTY